MEPDLRDHEVARMLAVSVRTIQRQCAAGGYPGAYKVGRFWRIPRRASGAGRVRDAALDDELANELRTATEACRQLHGELNDLQVRARENVPGSPVSPASRKWAEVSRELSELEAAIAGLAQRARRAPEVRAIAETRARTRPG